MHVGGQEVYRNSVLPTQFCCKTKTTIKLSLNVFKNAFNYTKSFQRRSNRILKCFLPNNAYFRLKLCAHRLRSLFGNIYLCEKAFSKMKHVKSHYRSALTGKYLQLILMKGSTNFESQLSKMFPPPPPKKEFNSSH